MREMGLRSYKWTSEEDADAHEPHNRLPWLFFRRRFKKREKIIGLFSPSQREYKYH